MPISSYRLSSLDLVAYPKSCIHKAHFPHRNPDRPHCSLFYVDIRVTLLWFSLVLFYLTVTSMSLLPEGMFVSLHAILLYHLLSVSTGQLLMCFLLLFFQLYIWFLNHNQHSSNLELAVAAHSCLVTVLAWVIDNDLLVKWVKSVLRSDA